MACTFWGETLTASIFVVVVNNRKFQVNITEKIKSIPYFPFSQTGKISFTDDFLQKYDPKGQPSLPQELLGRASRGH